MIEARLLRTCATLLGACLAAAVLAGTVSAASRVATHPAAAEPQHCTDDGVKCLHVFVPIDRDGTVPGKISLLVEEHLAPGTPRGVMFLLAGGPGQGSADLFYIGAGSYWQRTFPGYDLVAFDPRGTGYSAPLKCSRSKLPPTALAAITAGCARHLGAARDFYSTADNAMDIDSVRQALGFERIGLLGVSYGTDVALTYARMYPTRVRRLVLDSVFAPFNSLSLVAAVTKHMPRALKLLCSQRCPGPTKNFAREVVALASALEKKPIRGRVHELHGTRWISLDAPTYLHILLGSDVAPGLAAELPAAVAGALHGDPSLLLRLYTFFAPPDAADYPDPVYSATVCDDGPFPWQPDTPLAERPALLASAIAKIPASAYGGFGTWAATFGNAVSCLQWPVSTRPAITIPETYPNVPVLAVSGTLDVRAPTFEARAALAHFPHGHLLLAVNMGHAALSDEDSTCLSFAVRGWLSGHRVPGGCDSPLTLAPFPAFPVAQSPPLTAAALLPLVTDTLREAEAVCSFTPDGDRLAGLRAGELISTQSGCNLAQYRAAGGIGLSGVFVTDTSADRAWRFAGAFKVDGPAGQLGSLSLAANGTLSGELDGRIVVSSRLLGPVAPTAGAAPWSAWTPPKGSPAEVANAIARYVGGTYLLNPQGQKLDVVKAAAAGSRSGPLRRGIFDIAARPAFYTNDFTTWSFVDPSTTWTYSLCGQGPRCSIASGEPSLLRGRLLEREGLELALYTFRFDPSVDSVVVYLSPSTLGDLHRHPSLLLFERNGLEPQLAKPLARVLRLATPPLPTVPDPSEEATIQRLVRPHFYGYEVDALRNGEVSLTLNPEPFES